MVNTTPIPERFWKRVQKTPDCWLWLGAVHETGYGKFWDAFVREWTLAHRVSYVLIVGSIPRHTVLHHKCKNKLCVNPQHLEILSRESHVEVHRDEMRRTGGRSDHHADRITDYGI